MHDEKMTTKAKQIKNHSINWVRSIDPCVY